MINFKKSKATMHIKWFSSRMVIYFIFILEILTKARAAVSSWIWNTSIPSSTLSIILTTSSTSSSVTAVGILLACSRDSVHFMYDYIQYYPIVEIRISVLSRVVLLKHKQLPPYFSFVFFFFLILAPTGGSYPAAP